jgi:alpha-tubulin suppressor-like RCC1 family protein
MRQQQTFSKRRQENSRMIFLKLLLSICLCAFLFTCTNLQNPFTKDKAQVFLHLESSAKTASDSTITDTAGNKIRIGVSYFMPEYFDSVVITIGRSIQNIDTFFICKKAGIKDDTAWYEYALIGEGTRTITARGFIAEGYQSTATAGITVIARPFVPENHKPELIITGRKSITIAETCTLFVSASHIDSNQTLTYKVIKGPQGYVFLNQIFTWKPTTADTGVDSMTFSVADNGVPIITDTQTIGISIKGVDFDTTKPIIKLFDPLNDSLAVSANTLMIKVIAKDSSGILGLRVALNNDTFPSTRADSVWTATISNLLIGYNTITITATDLSQNKNPATRQLTIKYDPAMADSSEPIIFLKTGARNGSVVTDAVIAITDSILDVSGIDSVYWTLNGKSPKPLTLVSGTTNLYSLVDTLRQYKTNIIVVYAVDKATNKNKASQTIVLNYTIPPVINDTSVFTNRNVAKTWVINVLSGDNDTLTWSSLSLPSTLSGVITGTLPSITFTPATNWYGADSFKVRITDGYWCDTVKVKITVVNVTVAPTISTPPLGATKNVGQSITFSVAVNTDVNPVPSYSWKHNGAEITNATDISYTISSITLADSGSYTVTVSNSAGTATSSPAILTVNYAPTITTQPASQTLYYGQTVTLTVLATGKPTPTFVWKKNENIITGQTGASLIIVSPAAGDSGNYTVTASNSVGTKISDTARFYAGIKTISAGGGHTLILKTDASLFACGLNNSGQLGDSTGIDQHKPKFIMGQVQNVAAGFVHSLILKMDGTLLACGDNSYGQLGDGTVTKRQYPIKILNNVKNIAAGKYHTLVLLNNGILLGCGANYSGQLGDGTEDDQKQPITIMNGVQSMAAGASYTLVLKTNDSLYACGENIYGQLGNGTTQNAANPIPVADDVKSAVAGYNHSLIIKKDGTLFVCGSNLAGQLGNGTRNNIATFTQVTNGVQSIAASEEVSFYVENNGALFACGMNNLGQTGDGSTIYSKNFKQILTDVKNVMVGEDFSFILKKDGILLGCGNNALGQLGNGTTTNALLLIELKY